MTSHNDQFQITLPSNVKEPKTNKPAEFETRLAKPLDLPGSWEVALIDVSYPHDWIILRDAHYLLILTEKLSTDISLDIMIKNGDEILNVVLNDLIMNEFRPRSAVKIDKGNYTLEEILEIIKTSIEKELSLKDLHFKIEHGRFKIKSTDGFVLASYTKNSLLAILGVETTKKTHPNYGEWEYFKYYGNQNAVEAKRMPSLPEIPNIFVYTDIIETSRVGDTQAPLLGFIPIQSKFGAQGYWSFNPPYYEPIKDSLINSITMKLCTDTGDLVPFGDGKVICRLNFRRRGLFF